MYPIVALTVSLRRNLTGNANAKGYRKDTERVRECERNAYRMDIERILNGYRRVMDQKREKSVLECKHKENAFFRTHASKLRYQSAYQRFKRPCA